MEVNGSHKLVLFSYDNQFEGTKRILHKNVFAPFKMQDSTQAWGRKSGFICIDHVNWDHEDGSSLGSSGPQSLQRAESGHGEGSYLLRQENMIGKQNAMLLPGINEEPKRSRRNRILQCK